MTVMATPEQDIQRARALFSELSAEGSILVGYGDLITKILPLEQLNLLDETGQRSAEQMKEALDATVRNAAFNVARSSLAALRKPGCSGAVLAEKIGEHLYIAKKEYADLDPSKSEKDIADEIRMLVRVAEVNYEIKFEPLRKVNPNLAGVSRELCIGMADVAYTYRFLKGVKDGVEIIDYCLTHAQAYAADLPSIDPINKGDEAFALLKALSNHRTDKAYGVSRSVGMRSSR